MPPLKVASSCQFFCELSYDFIEPTFISLNEIKEPERPKMEEVKEDYNPFKLIKDLLCRKNEKS